MGTCSELVGQMTGVPQKQLLHVPGFLVFRSSGANLESLEDVWRKEARDRGVRSEGVFLVLEEAMHLAFHNDGKSCGGPRLTVTLSPRYSALTPGNEATKPRSNEATKQ